jgi:hypothetical protein
MPSSRRLASNAASPPPSYGRNVLQHCSAGGLDNFSDVVICSILSLRAELKSGEQICRLFNEVDVIWEQETGLAP